MTRPVWSLTTVVDGRPAVRVGRRLVLLDLQLQTEVAAADLWDLRRATDKGYLLRAVTGTRSR